MIRRLAGVLCVVVCALVAAFATVASAEAPPGPRLAFLRIDLSSVELINGDAAGRDQLVIAGGGEKVQPTPVISSAPTWSADGSRIAFEGITHVGRDLRSDIYLAAPDGTGLTRLSGTREGQYPILSPDGQTAAFVRERERRGRRPSGERTVFDSVSIWLVGVAGGPARQLTPWRNWLFDFPDSFSPDGSTLAISREYRDPQKVARFRAVAMQLDGSGSHLLAEHALDPVYSPDGSRIALVLAGRVKTISFNHGTLEYAPTDLAIAAADGSGLTRLTHTRVLEGRPSWDPSGQRLAYTQLKVSTRESNILGFGDSIMEINADGSCRTRILSKPRVILNGPTWQPGQGRGAGPIRC